MGGRKMRYRHLKVMDEVKADTNALEHLMRTVPRAPPSPWDPEPGGLRTRLPRTKPPSTQETAKTDRLRAIKASANRMRRK